MAPPRPVPAALYVWPSSLTLTERQQIAAVALAVRLPSVHPFVENAVAGDVGRSVGLVARLAVRLVVHHGATVTYQTLVRERGGGELRWIWT